MKEREETSMDKAIENIISIMPLLSKSLKQFIKGKTTLSAGAVYVCAALNHHGKLSMSEIGAHVAAPKPHVTTLVDKLIEDDMAERLNDPNDRRIIYIQLTEKGKAFFQSLKTDVHEEFRDKLRFLSAEEADSLAASSQKVRDSLIAMLKSQYHGSSDRCSD